MPAAIAGGRAPEKQPTFCASCHESQEYYDLWLRSGAAKDHPNCIECHNHRPESDFNGEGGEEDGT